MAEQSVNLDAGDSGSTSSLVFTSATGKCHHSPDVDEEEAMSPNSSLQQEVKESTNTGISFCCETDNINISEKCLQAEFSGACGKQKDACDNELGGSPSLVCRMNNLSLEKEVAEQVQNHSDFADQNVNLLSKRELAQRDEILFQSNEDPPQVVECVCENVQKEMGSCDREADSYNVSVNDEEPISALVSWQPPYQGGLRLDELHDDVILAIALFLDAREIHFGLAKVCQRFNNMFDNDVYWKTRIHMKCPKTYPALPVEDFSWVEACVAREDSYRVWENWTENTHHFMYNHNVNGEVDVVHLMKDGQLMVSGDRNRVLNIVDLAKWKDSLSDPGREMLVHTDSSHGGWIWSLASLDNTLITGSWDTMIRLFDVATPDCRLLQKFKCSTAVLSLYAAENEIVASCFREVVFVDRRSSQQTSVRNHTMPVLCVVADDRYVVTGSEDRSLCVHDRRQCDRVLLKHKLDTYPMCMSFLDNQLWFGDKQGQLHLLDATSGTFNLVGTYPTHTVNLTGVVATKGAIFTSGDKTVKVSEPTQDPGVITTLDVHSKQVAKIDFNNGVLASAGGDECVAVWMPKAWASRYSQSLV